LARKMDQSKQLEEGRKITKSGGRKIGLRKD
jgi:hypothetical protein